jgi:hypothetical protein
MKLLFQDTNYKKTIDYAVEITNNYHNINDNVSTVSNTTFHCYWNGILNEKHLMSIKSCYCFHKKHKIILWLENNTPNQFNEEIHKYAEIRHFYLDDEIVDTFLHNVRLQYDKHRVSFYSDIVRYVLLYKYGGCWFDLDCFFLRSFEPLFFYYGYQTCVYQWEDQNYPNGAIYISLEPRSERMKQIIQFIIQRNRGWGFQESHFTYDLPVDLFVLPCSWFDSDWIVHDANIGFDKFFKRSNQQYSFDNFFPGAFCYHWHNQWDVIVYDDSIAKQLMTIVDKTLL